MSIGDCELDCSMKNHSSEQLFRAMILKNSSDCNTLRVEASTTNDTNCIQLTCDEAMFPAQVIFRKLLLLTDSGCLALRVVNT